MAELRHVPSNGCGNAGTVRGTHIKRPWDIGGGIRNEGGMLTLVESTISGNTASDVGGGSPGGRDAAGALQQSLEAVFFIVRYCDAKSAGGV